MNKRNDAASSDRANGSSEEPDSSPAPGWDEERGRFGCTDDTVLEIPRTVVFLHAKEGKSKVPRTKLAVSGVRFSRDMKEIIMSEDAIRTITSPKTVRAVRQKAFFKNHKLVSAVVNEGLEVLGTDERNNNDGGNFENSGLRRVKLP